MLDRGRGRKRLELAGAKSIQDPWLRFRVFDASDAGKWRQRRRIEERCGDH